MIRLVIAEDQRILRGALASLLDFEEGMEVVGQAENGEQALELVLQENPDVCLMDIEMPIKSGLEAAAELKERKSACKVIILTTFARPGYFEKAIKAGVHGYLLKDGAIEELAESIRRVVKGKHEFAQELIMNSFKEDNPLTAREQEILLLAAAGETSKEIAKNLFHSAGTVRNYMSEILQKLQSKNKIEAISEAKNKGWIK